MFAISEVYLGGCISLTSVVIALSLDCLALGESNLLWGVR